MPILQNLLIGQMCWFLIEACLIVIAYEDSMMSPNNPREALTTPITPITPPKIIECHLGYEVHENIGWTMCQVHHMGYE